MLRAGILYRAQEFFDLVSQEPLKEKQVIDSHNDLFGVSLEDIFSTSKLAGWIVIDDEGIVRLSNKGSKIVELRTAELRLRQQVMDIVDGVNPYWMNYANKGRSVISKYLTGEELQCFIESGLLTSLDDDVIIWWDRHAAASRGENDFRQLDIGRKGERLSYDMESRRTGVEPKWVSIENPDLGYDLISQISSFDDSQLYIEVKASTRPWDSATFFLSKNEWRILSNEDNSQIHLWSISRQPPLLAVVRIDSLEEHIPANRGEGKWTCIECPFDAWAPRDSDSYVHDLSI
jgi:hypothetical protein